TGQPSQYAPRIDQLLRSASLSSMNSPLRVPTSSSVRDTLVHLLQTTGSISHQTSATAETHRCASPKSRGAAPQHGPATLAFRYAARPREAASDVEGSVFVFARRRPGHHALSPTSVVTAGTRRLETTKDASRIPIAIAKPICFVASSG